MSFYNLFQTENFAEVFGEVQEFSRRKLSDYNNHLEKMKLSKSSKEIFDAVWGNIEFSPGEIYILDSPLLQRLRKIKQLGLAYFVYCGSDYSRFYHTTGVVFLADRMATSLNKCDIGKEKEKEYFKAVVRLAAMFHDAGHMFLSHVSEHYFGSSPLYPRHDLISKMLDDFERKGGKRVALHELISCMIVNTTEVKRLLKTVSKRLEGISLESEEDMEMLVEYVSGLITGVPVDRAVLPYSSIINGPIDADKCDYLSRDSHVTRVPVAVDISRLTQKICVVESENISMPELWHMDSDTQRPFKELAMSDSAEKALFQLCIARTIMFDSVYYHHKVLTAETELRGLLNKLSNLKAPVFNSFVEILEYTDEDFNRFFFEQLKSGRDGEDVEIIAAVQNEWEEICNRSMAKRIACIMQEYLLGEQRDTERLFDEVLTSLNTSEEKYLLDEVHEQYLEICNLTGRDVSETTCNTFIVQSPTNVYGHSKIQVPIHLHNGKQRDFRGYELVNSRETSSSASYVVTNAEHRLLMYFALEKVLYKRYHVRLKEGSSACGKFEQDEQYKYHTKLIEKGYYDDTPELVKDFYLEHHIQKTQIQRLVDKFSAYEGPNRHSITKDVAWKFFKQVVCTCKDKKQIHTIIDGIYRMLDTALFLGRSFVSESISDALEKADISGDTVMVVPLGGPRDSGKNLMYYFNDVKLKNGKQIIVKESLREVLEQDKDTTIVFFDDGSYSGTQVLSIMQEYLGTPKEERATSEEHVEPLAVEFREKFSNMKIIFCFIAFNAGKIEDNKSKLKKIGIKNTEFVYSEDMSEKLFDRNNIFENDKQKKAVKQYLQDVGFGIMDSMKKVNGKYNEHWDEERVEKSALGYNDAQQMVFLTHSVPTYTITPFWQPGEYRGFEWNPLFHRTIKDIKDKE